MSELNVWNELKTAGVVSGELPQSTAKAATHLWYVRVLQGFAGWVAAVFLLGFLGFGVIGLFEHGTALITMGVIINLSSYVYFKAKPESDFFNQLVLVFSLTGQFLVAFGLLELYGFSNRQWLLLVGLYQLLLMGFINHYLHRFLSTWFAVIALFWGFELLIYTGLGSALVAALFVWLWLDKTGWRVAQEFYEPIAYALGFSLLQLNVQSQLWLNGYWLQSNQAGWVGQNAAGLTALVNSLVLLYFVYRMIEEQRISWSSTAGRLAILAAVIMLFSALPVIGVSSALLVLLVGFARQNKLLQAMGCVALLGFVSWYYYLLNITLLHKSLLLIVIGAVLLLGALVLKYTLLAPKAEAASDARVPEKFTLTHWQKAAAGLTLVLALVGINHAIWQKEQVLLDGQSVFLELAPVDPRSIMQGDYMRLRFAMAQSIRANIPVSSLPGEQVTHDGYVMVKLDERRVGHFYALVNGINNTPNNEQASAETLLKLQYRVRNNRVQFATNAFFFQEGDAQLFNAARYGEFKVAENGELLLVAMYDKDLILLGQNRMN